MQGLPCSRPSTPSSSQVFLLWSLLRVRGTRTAPPKSASMGRPAIPPFDLALASSLSHAQSFVLTTLLHFRRWQMQLFIGVRLECSLVPKDLMDEGPF